MTAVLTAVTADGRGDARDRLAAARAALTRAETAAGLRTRLGGPTSAGTRGELGASAPGASAPAATAPARSGHGGTATAGSARTGTDGRPVHGWGLGSVALLGAVDPDPSEEASARRIHALGADRTLPVPVALTSLFPGGALARGTVVQVSGSTSVLLALAAAAGADGAWSVLAALPHVGWRAAAGAGLALDRVAVVPVPGPDAAGVLGALVDGFDVLVVGRCSALSERDRRSLTARVRARGAVLLSGAEWPGAQQALRVTRTGWEGLGQGWGHLVDQELTVRATGRGTASGTREVRVRLGRDGLLGAAPGALLGAAPDGSPGTGTDPTAEPARPLLRAV